VSVNWFYKNGKAVTVKFVTAYNFISFLHQDLFQSAPTKRNNVSAIITNEKFHTYEYNTEKSFHLCSKNPTITQQKSQRQGHNHHLIHADD
jgi:hypothetical protein